MRLWSAAAVPPLFALLTSFETVSEWRALPADGVELRISNDAGKVGKAMRLDFDFRGHGGYAIARLDRPIDLPENFEFTFWIRGEAPPNTLEFKLIDDTGENVWWTTKRDFEFPRDWKRVSLKKRHFSFAWGPLRGGPLPKRIAALEIVVTAGRGGKGTVWIDELALDALETSTDIPPPFTPAAGKTITLNLSRRLEFGGMTIDWIAGKFPKNYTVQTSVDGKEWETVREVRGGNGGRDYIAVPDGDAQYVRIETEKPGAVRQIALKPVDWSKTPNDFFTSIASDDPRGNWPRYLLHEQLYWTVVGTDGSEVEALVSEDGMVEVGNAHSSIEPFLWMNGKLMTWSDTQAVQSLEDNHRPIPSVEWFGTLRVTADVDENDVLNVRYRIPPGARLYLAIRPLQVNPPWQFLKRIGGAVKISRVSYSDGKITVDAEQTATLTPSSTPAAFGATTFDGGNIVDFLRRGTLPEAQEVNDQYGYASAAMEFRERDVTIRVPLGGKGTRGWHRKLNRVRIDTPEPRIFDSIRSNLAYILINRDGPSIQPGSRSYERSWIRDGSLTSTALLRLGHPEVVREFAEWYAQFQYEDGKIPCCVSPAGADPVPEHDSHGQFIYLIAEYYRHTRDRAFVERMWPRIEKTVAFIDRLRHERMTPKYEGTVFYGLVPESISHEGYSAKPMHSYWDDFFILRGLKDAVFLANELGKPEVSRYAAIRDDFEKNLLASIERAIAQHRIDYIPGSAELGDFDATSTTIAISPVDEQEKLPQAALLRTFSKHMETALEPRNYTPYEWRVVGALIRLGQKDQALQLMRRFFRDQRPPGWNHWAEVVFKDPRHPGFIGDMPHTWVGSDFIRSALDLFVFEHEDKLIIGAGIDPAWLEKGVSIENVSTHFGKVSYSMKKVGDEIVVEMPVMPKPPGGIIVRHPLTGRDVALTSRSMRLK